MFFNLVLLNHQHNGRFGIAWLAGTRGIKYVNRKETASVDISKLCDDLTEYIFSQSTSPRARFSLRLSAILINGALKIYREQTIYLLNDLVKALSFIARPVSLISKTKGLSGSFDTPPTPIIQKKSKKRLPVETLTPISQLEKILGEIVQKEDVSLPPIREKEILAARVDDVTLRETQLQQQPAEELGDLGAPLPEEILQQLTEIEQILHPGLPLEISEAVPVQVAEVSKQPITLLPEAAVITRSENERQVEVERTLTEPPVEQIVLPEPEVQPVRRPLAELPIAIVPQRVDNKISRKKKRDQDLENLLISTTRSTRVARINRCDPNEVDWIDLSPCPLPEFKLKTPDLSNLIRMYMTHDYEVDQLRKRSKEESLDSAGSVTLARRSRKVATPPIEVPTEVPAILAFPETVLEQVEVEIGVQPVILPKVLITSTPTKRTFQEDLEQRTEEQMLAITGEETGVTPRKRTRLEVEPELPKDREFVSIPSDIPFREFPAEISSIHQKTIESIQLPIISERVRQQEIMNKVVINKQLTLEDVAQKPLNKLNIARAFGDVLVLCKSGYVKLISEETSTQLAFIEKGPKVLKRGG